MTGMQTEEVLLSLWQQVVLVLVSSTLICSSGLLTRLAEVDSQVLYSPIACTLFSELLKLVISVTWALSDGARGTRVERGTSHVYNVVAFAPSALGYLFVNNGRYLLVRLVNPGLLAVLWNLKIVVVGLLYNCPPFRRRFTRRQWSGAALLVLGTSLAELSQWGSSDVDGNSNTGGALGLALAFFLLSVTSLSAMACEFAYKTTQIPLPHQNMILYLYGVVLNLVSQLAHAAASDEPSRSLTANFTAWTWGLVVVQALSGFLIGAIFKYLDVVAQVFSDVIATLLTAAIAFFLFGLDYNTVYALGLFLSAGSLLVYYSERFSPRHATPPHVAQTPNDAVTSIRATSTESFSPRTTNLKVRRSALHNEIELVDHDDVQGPLLHRAAKLDTDSDDEDLTLELGYPLSQ